jgi:hypothetical protein
MTMWLPTPVYERLPQFWFLLGLLFVANGLYLGLHIPISLAHVCIGFACCGFGLGVAVVRNRYRRDPSENDNSMAPSE